MAENDHPVLLLHKFLANAERMLHLEPQSLADYKTQILALKSSIQAVEQHATQLEASNSSQDRPATLSHAEEQELRSLKEEKEQLVNGIGDMDAQLLKLLDQLRRLQFSLDGMDASAYQRPSKPK
jgi:septal ring factor EnvC (AmiA/AmiB activator)